MLHEGSCRASRRATSDPLYVAQGWDGKPCDSYPFGNWLLLQRGAKWKIEFLVMVKIGP